MDGVLLRMAVGDGHWAEDIPPVPEGFTVTVSFGSAAATDEHRDALGLLGYRTVDGPALSDADFVDTADFLISHALLEQHPTYWRSVAGRAERAYHLSLGPAAAMVAHVVAAHAAHLGR